MVVNVVLEKAGEDQLDRSCEKWESVTWSQVAEEYPTEIRKWKANWIGHILRRYYLLKQVIAGKIKGETEMKIRRGRRRKKLLDDLKHMRGYSHLKEEALDCTMWRDRFGRGFGPVVRQNTEWMNWNLPEYKANPCCLLHVTQLCANVLTAVRHFRISGDKMLLVLSCQLHHLSLRLYQLGNLDAFSWNLILRSNTQICWEIKNLFTVTLKHPIRYMKA
jgi:hypothetical protein